MDDDRLTAGDSLLLFPSEPERPECARAARQEEDALALFLSETEVPGEQPPSGVEADEPRTDRLAWMRAAAPAWCVAAALVVCVLAIVGGIVGTRGTDSVEALRRASAERLGGMPPSDRSSLADLPARTATKAAPPAEPQASPDRSTDVVAAVSDDNGDASRGTIPSAQDAALPALTEVEADPRPAYDPDSAPGLVSDDLIAASVPPVTPISLEPPVFAAPASAPSSSAPPAVAETDAVRRTLDAYRAAYEALDVPAAADVWPTVDRRALARAFSTLESQALTLGECDIQVAQATATARCQGNVRFVRTFGSRDPVNAPTGWLFRMRKAGESWTIEDVTGTDAGRN